MTSDPSGLRGFLLMQAKSRLLLYNIAFGRQLYYLILILTKSMPRHWQKMSTNPRLPHDTIALRL